MIYITLSKYDSGPINKNIIEWVREHFQRNNINYKLIWCREYMFESEIEFIKQEDYVFWNPVVASKNLDFVKRFRKSIVIVQRQTLLTEKINDLNPINENQAVNNDFYLMYLNETEQISKEWKLAIQSDNYLMRQADILHIILDNKENYRKVFIERPDVYKEKDDIIKNQINYDE